MKFLIAKPFEKIEQGDQRNKSKFGDIKRLLRNEMKE